MNKYEEKEVRHRKKAQKKVPKKANHKHEFKEVGPDDKYNFLTKSVCEICGKTKSDFNFSNFSTKSNKED